MQAIVVLKDKIVLKVTITYNSTTQIYWTIDEILTQKNTNRWVNFAKEKGTFQINYFPVEEDMWARNGMYPLIPKYYKSILKLIFNM